MIVSAVEPAVVLYVGSFFIAGLVCLLGLRRAWTVSDREVRLGLAGLLGTTGIWAVLKSVFFLLDGPLREGMYTVGLIFGFATVWAWLYFASAYTGREYHRNTTLRRLGAGVFLAVVAVKLTNPFHRLYFTTTEATTPFRHLAIDHGPLHWSATGLSYVLAAVGIFMIFEHYLRSGYDTRPLAVLSVLLGIPVVLDMVALATPRLINVIYAPLGVAAFAVGSLFVFEQRFLAVQNTGQDDQPAIFLSEDGQIRDVSAAAIGEFPALEGAIGERIGDVLPAVARVLESDDRIVEVDGGDEDGPRYYLVSPTEMTIGDSAVRVVSLTDVTGIERQRRRLVRRERELNEQNELYRAVIAASFAFVLRLDRDGRISYVSPSVEEVIGYTPEELDSEPIGRLHPDDETTAQATEYLDEVLTGESLQVRDFPLETKMDRTVYTDFRIVPIYEASVPADERTPDDIVGAQTMIRDATARRRREGLISVTNRVLRHNVRNEMTVVNGYAEMLADQLDGDAASKAERIVETADRLLAISESARRIEENRDQSPELDAVDVVPLIDRLVTQLEDRHWDAAVTVDAPDAAVAETLPRLETALWEILENAAKHGGDPASVEVTVATTDHQVVISIKDDGPGLPDDERTVLAAGAEEPLVHGQGLGLWLAYYLVTNLRGEIEVPETRRGTTVEIRLPRSDA